ncbi:MAG: ABC transporter permease [Candidatus Woesebacteria bacterium]|jgi:lipopolysaccharide transport system permease protein
MVKSLIKPFLHHKYLFYQLSQREIKARYKQSFIGYAWILFNPLSQVLVYTFVFSIVFKFSTVDIPYPIFLLAALLPWTFTLNSISTATQSLVANVFLLKKVAFPREIIPYSVIVSKFVDLFFSSLVFLLLLLIFKIFPTLSFLYLIPVFLIHLFLTVALSLLLAAFNLFYRDIQYLANLLLTLWMYMSPIAYPMSMVPEKLLVWYKLNPLVGIVEGYRSAIFNYPFETNLILWSAFFSFSLFVLSFLIFKKLEKYFTDIV